MRGGRFYYSFLKTVGILLFFNLKMVWNPIKLRDPGLKNGYHNRNFQILEILLKK